VILIPPGPISVGTVPMVLTVWVPGVVGNDGASGWNAEGSSGPACTFAATPSNSPSPTRPANQIIRVLMARPPCDLQSNKSVNLSAIGSPDVHATAGPHHDSPRRIWSRQKLTRATISRKNRAVAGGMPLTASSALSSASRMALGLGGLIERRGRNSDSSSMHVIRSTRRQVRRTRRFLRFVRVICAAPSRQYATDGGHVLAGRQNYSGGGPMAPEQAREHRTAFCAVRAHAAARRPVLQA
jgi:hypothetical protein